MDPLRNHWCNPKALVSVYRPARAGDDPGGRADTVSRSLLGNVPCRRVDVCRDLLDAARLGAFQMGIIRRITVHPSFRCLRILGQQLLGRTRWRDRWRTGYRSAAPNKEPAAGTRFTLNGFRSCSISEQPALRRACLQPSRRNFPVCLDGKQKELTACCLPAPCCDTCVFGTWVNDSWNCLLLLAGDR